MEPTVVARECRFAIHVPERHNLRPDLHLVKEQLHMSDGTIRPAIRFIQNFERPFWATIKNRRTYKQKKEWEHIDNLVEYKCTDSQLRDRVAKALELNYTNDHLKKLLASPYIYGTDISAASLIKKQYMDQYPNHRTPFTVATFDTETKTINGITYIKLATIAFQNKVFTVVHKDLIRNISNLDLELNRLMDKYLPQYRDKLEAKILICETEVDMLREVFQKAHEWSPDILAIWNMNYDIPKVLATLDRYGVAYEDILCDPKIPKSARVCKYKEGKKKKVTASGKVTPINPASQWHTLILTASFYVLDAMCIYKQLRLAKQEEPSYSLDAILNKELGSRKLTFTAADNYHGLKWHEFMQEHYPVEYIVYNRYDCISMLELDAKIKDLSYTISEFAGVTEFERFNSQPKKIADALYFYLLDQNYILGSVGYDDNDDGKDDDEDSVLDLKNWIITLPAELQVSGLKLIAGNDDIATNIRAMVYDSDAVSAYPTATESLSVSKETTCREIIRIKGVPERLFRMQNINLMSGPINALEYATTMFKLPKPHEVLDMYLKQK